MTTTETQAKAMSALRKEMVAAEQSRAAVASLIKASSRSGETVAAAMTGLVADQMKALEAAHTAVGVALKALVVAATPASAEPEKKPAK